MNDRRAFLKLGLGATGLAILAPAVGFPMKAWAEKRRGGGGGATLSLVKPGEGMAAGVNYVHEHKDLKNDALKTVRQGLAFDKQFCNNCMLYSKHGEEGGKEVGKCTIFPNQVVRSTGWCTTWSKKS